MADAAPPQKQSGPGRWILLGCGILSGLLILGMGGCAGIFYAIYRGSDDTAKIGETYLRNAPELRNVIDEHANVDRDLMAWSVSIVNDRGHAHFTYTIKHDEGRPTHAVVWLTRSASSWQPVGARVRPPTGGPIEIGKPPNDHRIDWD